MDMISSLLNLYKLFQQGGPTAQGQTGATVPEISTYQGGRYGGMNPQSYYNNMLARRSMSPGATGIQPMSQLGFNSGGFSMNIDPVRLMQAFDNYKYNNAPSDYTGVI